MIDANLQVVIFNNIYFALLTLWWVKRVVNKPIIARSAHQPDDPVFILWKSLFREQRL